MKKYKITGQIVDNETGDFFRDFLGIESTSPKNVKKFLDEANGEDIVIEINSPGGSVFDGVEIYNELNSYKGNVTVDIVGLAASISSVIATAGNKTRISAGSMIMIHNVSSGAYGDYNDMNHQAEILKTANKSIAHAYELKTGMSGEELLELMNKETWLDSKTAIELKFADELLNNKTDSNKNLNLSNTIGVNILSNEVVQNLKNKLFDSSINEKDNSDFLFKQNKLKAELKLKKLKEVQ